MPDKLNPKFECIECYCCECEICFPDGLRVKCLGCGAQYDIKFVPQYSLRKYGQFHDLPEEAEGATA